jgi:hypothetical protein
MIVFTNRNGQTLTHNHSKETRRVCLLSFAKKERRFGGKREGSGWSVAVLDVMGGR